MCPDGETRFAGILEKLKKTGYRLTPQRLAILKVLTTSKAHPSADQIYETVRRDFPTTSLATVYKTISMMKKTGDILELEFSRNNNRYDGRTPFAHPHVICTECGTIIDPDSLETDKITKKIMEETGFRIVNHRMDFYGVCPRCQQGQSA